MNFKNLLHIFDARSQKRTLPNGGCYHFEVRSYQKELDEFDRLMKK